MPYVFMQVTREEVTREQKATLIKGVTGLLAQVLNKNPAQTFVVIAGMTVSKYRRPEQAVADHAVG